MLARTPISTIRLLSPIPIPEQFEIQFPSLAESGYSSRQHALNINQARTPMALAQYVNLDIKSLNKLIELYNTKQKKWEKWLISVLQQLHRINQTYPLDLLVHFPYVHYQLHEQLWDDIIKAFHEHESVRMQSPMRIVSGGDSLNPSISSLLSTFLLLLPTNELRQFITALLGNVRKRNYQYRQSDFINIPIPLTFGDFFTHLRADIIWSSLNTCCITFTATNDYSKQASLLKMEHRFGISKNEERELTKCGFKYFVPSYGLDRIIDVDRKAYYLVVTDYFSRGNLADYATTRLTLHKIDPAQHKVEAIHFFSQMANVLTELQYKYHYVFSDCKLTNWFIDNNGDIRIGDSKSLTPINRLYLLIQKALPFQSYISTAVVSPFELLRFDPDTFSAEAIHAYILGANLYWYLTNCHESRLSAFHAQKPDYKLLFADPVFHHADGQILKYLIIELLRFIPSQRMQLKEALKLLTYLAIRPNPSISLSEHANQLVNTLYDEMRLDCENTLRFIETNCAHALEPLYIRAELGKFRKNNGLCEIKKTQRNLNVIQDNLVFQKNQYSSLQQYHAYQVDELLKNIPTLYKNPKIDEGLKLRYLIHLDEQGLLVNAIRRLWLMDRSPKPSFFNCCANSMESDLYDNLMKIYSRLDCNSIIDRVHQVLSMIQAFCHSHQGNKDSIGPFGIKLIETFGLIKNTYYIELSTAVNAGQFSPR